MPASFRAHGVLLIALLLLPGCVGFQLIPPGPVRAGAVEVTASGPWNRLQAPGVPAHVEVWTRDGLALEQLLVFKGVEPGRSLLERPMGAGAEPLPTFRAEMAPDEAVEFILATFGAIPRGKSYELTQLAPAPFGDRAGFRFTFRSLSTDDLQREGIGLGTIVGGRLYLLVFEGSRLHHVPTRAPEVDQMLRSARLVGA